MIVMAVSRFDAWKTVVVRLIICGHVSKCSKAIFRDIKELCMVLSEMKSCIVLLSTAADLLRGRLVMLRLELHRDNRH